MSTLTKSDEVSSGMSAMAQTVGYPCAAATEYVLSGNFAATNGGGGVFRPTDPGLGEHILAEMAEHGIAFKVESQPIDD